MGALDDVALLDRGVRAKKHGADDMAYLRIGIHAERLQVRLGRRYHAEVDAIEKSAQPGNGEEVADGNSGTLLHGAYSTKSPPPAESLFRQNNIIFSPTNPHTKAVIWYNAHMAGKSKRLVVKAPPRRVVVALRMAGIAGQDKLNGIFDYLSAGRRWQLIIYRTKHEFTAEVVEHELARGTDGFIVGIPGAEDALAELAASDAPTVLMNVSGGGIENRKSNIAFVKSDSAAVGREAANALLKQGIYKSYGYAGYSGASTSIGVRPAFIIENL